MRAILTIGHNDLRLFLKRKSAYVWLFLGPLAFIYIFGSAYKTSGDPSNRQPAVWLENADTNFLGRIFSDELGAQGLRLVNPTNGAALGIRIPADFTRQALRGERVKVQFVHRDVSTEADAALVKLRLVRTLIGMNGHLIEAAMQPHTGQPLTEDRLRAVMAAPDRVRLDVKFAGRNPSPAGFYFSVPSNLLMYLMMNLMLFGGAAMAAERRNGVIQRLMTHPVGRGEVVVGKIYGLMLLGAVQIVFVLIVGKFLFGVNLGANLPAITLTLLIFAWVAGSLGVLAGSVLAAEDRVIGMCMLVSLLMAAMGGCWWPIEMAPPLAKVMALCVPTGWALQALNQLISFGNGLDQVIVPLLVLLAFGAVANLLAARFFRP